MDATEQGSVQYTANENGIATIEFSHPSSNSLPGKILNKLASVITELGKEEKVLVIILKSAGNRAFCAGASFDELLSIENLSQGKEFFSGFAKVINACRKCPKLIIGRVQGKAVGGGVGIAASVDYCFATKHASIKLSELAVGIGPFVVGPAVERKIGLSAMSQLTINATEFMSAEWALQKGLYMEVFEDDESMDQKIQSLSSKLSKSNPEAMRNLKKIFWTQTEHWDSLLSERAEMSGKLVLSDFSKQSILKFKKK